MVFSPWYLVFHIIFISFAKQFLIFSLYYLLLYTLLSIDHIFSLILTVCSYRNISVVAERKYQLLKYHATLLLSFNYYILWVISLFCTINTHIFSLYIHYIPFPALVEIMGTVTMGIIFIFLYRGCIDRPNSISGNYPFSITTK